MVLSKILLLLNLLLSLGLAFAGVAAPLDLLRVLDIKPISASAIIEQQVIIGGTFLGLAAFCIVGLVNIKYRITVLWILLIMTLSWFVVRAFALTMRSADNDLTYLYLGYEGIISGMLYLAILFEKRSTKG